MDLEKITDRKICEYCVLNVTEIKLLVIVEQCYLLSKRFLQNLNYFLENIFDLSSQLNSNAPFIKGCTVQK